MRIKMRNEIGRIEKDNVTFVEYEDAGSVDAPKYFVQVGIIGMYLTKKELDNLQVVLSYYLNIKWEAI